MQFYKSGIDLSNKLTESLIMLLNDIKSMFLHSFQTIMLLFNWIIKKNYSD
jgi:hypothetical protein